MVPWGDSPLVRSGVARGVAVLDGPRWRSATPSTMCPVSRYRRTKRISCARHRPADRSSWRGAPERALAGLPRGRSRSASVRWTKGVGFLQALLRVATTSVPSVRSRPATVTGDERRFPASKTSRLHTPEHQGAATPHPRHRDLKSPAPSRYNRTAGFPLAIRSRHRWSR